jgi:hypothetical protein
MKRPGRPQRARRATNSREWHDAMGAAPDPNGVFAKRGLKTWDDVHNAMASLTLRWEAMPEAMRQGYAFPNPEDR